MGGTTVVGTVKVTVMNAVFMAVRASCVVDTKEIMYVLGTVVKDDYTGHCNKGGYRVKYAEVREWMWKKLQW